MGLTPNKQVKELWAVIADNGEPSGEGIVAEFNLTVGRWIPFVTAENSNAQTFKGLAPKTGKRTVLRKFVQVDEDEVIYEGDQ